LVTAVAQCGGCHTDRNHQENVLAGNPNFMFGGAPLPAPNLTPDATGLGAWSDEQIVNAIRNGIDDEGRHLSAAMPYWLFHNLSDADVAAIVAYLRSIRSREFPTNLARAWRRSRRRARGAVPPDQRGSLRELPFGNNQRSARCWLQW
jgi:mono/diheme cytochrome c family protein